MSERRKVIARIVGGVGKCPGGHLRGQEWDLSDGPPAGMCQWAYNSIYPFYVVLRYGGKFPWQHGEGPSESVEVACPDPDNGQRIRLEARGTK